MAWDFSTDPDFQEQLDWMAQFVRAEIWPLETLVEELDQSALDRIYAPLQQHVKDRGLWAAHLDPELGGQGFGQLKLGLMHEILGTSPFAPNAFGCQAPDSGNSEILALAGTNEQKERWLHPLLAGDLKSAFSMTEPNSPGSDPTQLKTRAAARRRRLRDHRPQVVLVQRLDRRLPDRDGGDRPRGAPAPARDDVHRPGRHSRREHPARTSRPWSTRATSTASSAGTPEIIYDGVRIPAENRLGGDGEGFLIAQQRCIPDASTTACAGWASQGAPSTCSASARPTAPRTASRSASTRPCRTGSPTRRRRCRPRA
jgi:acyl-CoA dehydrogenase